MKAFQKTVESVSQAEEAFRNVGVELKPEIVKRTNRRFIFGMEDCSLTRKGPDGNLYTVHIVDMDD